MTLLQEGHGEQRHAVEIASSETSELKFDVKIEGTRGKVTCRLVVEVAKGEGIVILGNLESDVASFKIPEGRLREGVCPAQLEVIVEGRLFTPLTVDLNVKGPPQITATHPVVTKRFLTKQPIVQASLSERYRLKREQL